VRRNILLVDDDEHILELVTFFLTQSGFAVKVERDGFSALEALAQNHFDLMLLDITMPHMNGFKVLRALRGNEKTKYLPVIILTGNGSKEDIVKAKSFQVDDYLMKPPKKEDLFNRIERVLGGSPQIEEILLEKNDKNAHGILSFPVHLTSISKRGIILRAAVPIKKGEKIEGLNLALFKHLGLHNPNLEVTDCVALEDGSYDYFLSFVNLSQPDQHKIFEWIMGTTFRRRKAI